MVSAPVLTADPLEAVLLPVLPMEFDAWLRAAFAVVEAVEAASPEVVEHAPLVGDAVTIVDAAAVAVDEVIGVKVEDDVLVVDEDALGVEVVDVPRTAVGKLRDDAGELAAAVVTLGDDAEACDVVEDVAVDTVDDVDDDVELVSELLVCVVEDDAVADAGEQAVSAVAVAAGAPEMVPAVAFVVCVPLAVPPEVLTKIALRVSEFCQYCGAASITT
jgi:hypothetical protein